MSRGTTHTRGRWSRVAAPFRRLALLGSAFGLALVALATPARAFPGLFVGPDQAARISRSAHVVLLREGDVSVVTVMTDYEGPMKPFGVIVPVPSDVGVADVKVLQRSLITYLEHMTAPRFHEFFDMEPCEEGEPQQVWQLSRKAEGGGFLGQAAPDPSKKARELELTVEPSFTDGEYEKIQVLDRSSLDAALTIEGWTMSDAQRTALEPWLADGGRVILAKVNPNKAELLGLEGAQLSPLRFATRRPWDTIPARLGLLHAKGEQELLIFVLEKGKTYEVAGYETVVPPTNITISFDAKERMGEFYAALHDKIREKHPQSFLLEYIWPTTGCGEPCTGNSLPISDVLTLGADVIERGVPEAERNPDPPDLTAEEKAQEDAFLASVKGVERAKKKLELEKDRKEVARRRALIKRNEYTLTRLHSRYDAAKLPSDPKVERAVARSGGTTLPVGEPPTLADDKSERVQIRYNHYHPSIRVPNCDAPKKGRWGKPPMSYRGSSKIWVAEDLARRKRDVMDAAKLVLTPVRELGLPGQVEEKVVEPAKADAGTAKGGCGCRVAGSGPAPAGGAALLAAAAVAALLGRRRR